MEFEPESGAEPFVTPLAHRQFYPQELQALLHYAGFDIEEAIGDRHGEPDPETRTMIYVCRAK